MPRNGYWIECVPLSSVNSEELMRRISPNENLSPDLYSASVEHFPDLSVTAASPDIAIEKLRNRLKSIRDDYRQTGKMLPDLDNPVRPPQRLRKVQGWISVYIEVSETVI
jgi:hypothetical protein